MSAKIRARQFSLEKAPGGDTLGLLRPLQRRPLSSHLPYINHTASSVWEELENESTHSITQHDTLSVAMVVNMDNIIPYQPLPRMPCTRFPSRRPYPPHKTRGPTLPELVASLLHPLHRAFSNLFPLDHPATLLPPPPDTPVHLTAVLCLQKFAATTEPEP